ncbi:uncharacterized protein EI97DRAFT_430918 [Westerdykella ornata]|uniref:Transglutaminase-like domain-containing protein n=1 Tax=Westerdykella ornata TaxID=318751 RepID=A0A6A6JUD2_WESOR|nr:uncharacterized protein EI97DRAFT_430918 [Westerdykella ornata]KAF2278649.1 hypothetical protein EI97DRAFT_430918 [Westerdykella ornata]
MADPAPPSVSSIKSRIAALNLEEVHTPSPGLRPAYTYEHATTGKKKPPPPPPPAQRPAAQRRGETANNPPLVNNVTTSSGQRGNEPVQPSAETPKISPALPPRLPPRPSPKTAPSLPPRKSSEQSIKRRESNESISTITSIGSARTSLSATSTGGTKYHIRAPAYDPAKLPPLPAKKNTEEEKGSATLRAMKSKTSVVADRSLPPQLPARPPLPARRESQAQEPTQSQQRRIVAPPLPRSALSFALNKSTEVPPPLPANRPSPTPDPQPGAPPPIPLGSRPNLQAIMASKPKPGATPSSCLWCRDFSAPDAHAAQYPREQLPGADVAWLATQLTSPFPSATDKARAIFTWLHHNIDYDVHSYYSGNCTRSTPENTMTSGLAVCEGYAGLFAALALKSGLEAVVVGGHGKGVGYKPLKPGEPLPEFKPSGHAWNAVRIDNGEWKLLDACWGAGSVCGTYKRDFKAYWFEMDNNEFGFSHFPENPNYFFRTDGRAAYSWEEYWGEGERLTVYGPATPNHGISARSFQPPGKYIRIHDQAAGPVVRFQFSSVCPHWDGERHGKGKPYVMILHVGGRDGRNTDYVPFQTDGRVWWVDVQRTELGAAGQKVSVFAVTTVEGRDARGLGYEGYLSKKGRCAMGFEGVAMWELVV